MDKAMQQRTSLAIADPMVHLFTFGGRIGEVPEYDAGCK